jgi:signal transduction histidine kinase
VAESRTGGVHDLEYRIVRPDGAVRVVHSRGAVVEDGSTGSRRAVSIVQDITEHRRAEYLTAQVFEKSPHGIAVVGSDYRYRRANSVYERTLHVQAGGVVGMHMADVLGADAFTNVAKPYLDRCFAGEEVKFALWVNVAFGRMYASVSYTPLPLHSERIATALIIVSDLTEHMLAQENLQKAQTELAHMARVTTLAEIGSSIAHEINQPLAAIVMSGNACRRWLAGDPPNLDEAREAVARVINDGNRASEIVGRIRSLLQGGAPVSEPLNVNVLIQETIALVRAELTRRGVNMKLELDARPGDSLGDRIQLQQVLVNLILNSADAMSAIAEGARLLTVRSYTNDDGAVIVEVEDTGTGFAVDEVQRIFDAFYSSKKDGLGMGLSISRSIINAHGGELWATSNDGPGATLHFTLPPAV